MGELFRRKAKPNTLTAIHFREKSNAEFVAEVMLHVINHVKTVADTKRGDAVKRQSTGANTLTKQVMKWVAQVQAFAMKKPFILCILR